MALPKNWHFVGRVSAGINLKPILDEIGLEASRYRVTMEGDSQVLWVENPELVGLLQSRLASPVPSAQPLSGNDRASAKRERGPDVAPMTLGLLCLCFIGFGLVSLDFELARPFLFYDRVAAFTASADAWHNLRMHQYWRAITPIFLHFGALHIIFNGLWLWFLGTRVEQVYGKWTLLSLVLGIGLVSNVAEALVSFPVPFGGISGVVYGLLGFVWLLGTLRAIPEFHMPPALFPLMVVFLVLGWSGLMDLVIPAGEVANTAHTIGFLSGLALALAFLPWHRSKPDS
jgi:GlpG protein